MDYVKVDREEQIAVLTIDRQDKMNALNEQVQEEIAEAFSTLPAGEVRAAVITGAGEKAFVAGADIDGMSQMSPAEVRDFGTSGTRMMGEIEDAPFPVIAAINGFALGGGAEIALACDVRIATENARLGFPEVTIGIMPGAGGTQRLPRVVGAGVARELVFSGRMIYAREAKEIGLVDHVVGESAALSAAQEMAEQIANNAPVAVRNAKIAMNAARNISLASGIEREGDLFALLFATDDAREGMTAFAEKRKPSYVGR